ncbi:GH36-type glycosyl hydrolase domain-containing protein [Candidatus Nitrospira neomarina]|uniref:Amylo-alpha-1,6-glucosidase n=1 Tax=Candidatus Nitrospira neomarina TaxID=3020899 RepID=A0AA96GEV6_9BACT|nr:amylo-alpha-1,6-glucosidase [Candidatus Nitrospira neomarina]WNM60909.1 amylo-alpha-1,6-glucosidase [Candidatus Nitrospira neomarina]
MSTFRSRNELETIELANSSGLVFEFFQNGGLFRAMCHEVMINQILGNPLEGSLNNIYLRLRTVDSITFVPLIGPSSPSAFAYAPHQARWQGNWQDLAYTCSLTIHPEATLWFWTIDIRNTASTDRLCDVIYTQDIGLAHEGAVRNNEAYCSHYIDHHVLTHDKYGPVVCSRQNQACGDHHPWLIQGSTTHTRGFVTDGLAFYGLAYKHTNTPVGLTQDCLVSVKQQYEMAFCGLQSDILRIAPGESRSVTFYAEYVPHHPEPSQAADADRIRPTINRIEQLQEQPPDRVFTPQPAADSILHNLQMLTGQDVTEDEVQALYMDRRRHEEGQDGTLLSFFYADATHVVLKAKERLVERPHGHILRSGSARIPQDDGLSSTTHMAGVFHSHLTIGNTSFNKLLSITRTPFNIFKTSGLRIFIKRGATYHILGMPSCYEIGLHSCRWRYKTDQGWIVVDAWVSPEDAAAFVNIESDQANTFVILGNLVLGNHELDHQGQIDIDARTATATLRPHASTEMAQRYPDSVFFLTTSEPAKVEHIGTDEELFSDHQSRELPYLTFRTKPVQTFSLAITGSIVNADHAKTLCKKYQTQSANLKLDQQAGWSFWQSLGRQFHLSLTRTNPLCDKLNDIFYWYVHNAMVHYTTPHGLEQFSGAAWGVRDVCQGPIELLLATQHHPEAKQILLTVFAQQYEKTADWPQWFMFDRFANIQHPESHGDIILWPLKALAMYLEASNDFSILEIELPYTDIATFVRSPTSSTLLRHVRRTIDAIESRFIPGTALSAYGAGDWDDTLQPAQSAMREHMVSTWTVALTYQVFQQLGTAFKQAGLHTDEQRLLQLAGRIKADFNQHLLPDEVVSGFGYRHPDGRIEPIIHPSDTRTKIHYRLLPMTRSMIGELFTPEQVQAHLQLIESHLRFPDGVRLMNTPVSYQGGVRVLFRRAEESAHFGREIGLQYVHAHIRYIEAMCKIGQAEKAYDGILQILPITIQDQVSNAVTRQSNAYFSSSDADVRDRDEAEQLWDALRAGHVRVKGGWRIYSSGPGILINQVVSNFLGLRLSYDDVVIDPVLPKQLDGLRFTFVIDGKPITVIFSIAGDAPAMVQTVTINGTEMGFRRDHNPYRPGGVRIPGANVYPLLTDGPNRILISVA